MGTCGSQQSGKKNAMEELQKAKLKPLIQRLRLKYQRLLKQTMIVVTSNSLTDLQEQTRNIYLGLFKQKILQVNENKITMKDCKLDIAYEMLEVQILIFKYVQTDEVGLSVDAVKLFFELTGKFLVTLAKFMKTIYPRGDNMEAGELVKLFKQFDETEQYEYDILKNAGIVFMSQSQFDITDTIKKFLNALIDQTDKNYGQFYKMMEQMDPAFKIGRKISQNTSKYVKLGTGTVQIKSTEVARVLIKWVQELTQILQQPNKKISAKNDYNFYKYIPEQNRTQFTKCQEQSFRKILTEGLMRRLKQHSKDNSTYNNSTKVRKSKFRKFAMNLTKIFNESDHQQQQVSKQHMEVIKYSSFSNSFINWMAEEQLIQSIKCLVQVGIDFQEFRGALNLVKFKINDLMRCQILTNKKTIIEIYGKFRKLQEDGIIEIIKIKNRFQNTMSDAMVFFKMPNSFIICECQLILSQEDKGQDAKKRKNIEALNHFIYELQRSPFGVLGQIATILADKSQSVKEYCDKIKLCLRDTNKIQSCLNKHKINYSQKDKYRQLKSPILCSKCIQFHAKFSNQIKIHNCTECNIIICNQCTGDSTFQITDDMLKKSLNIRLDTSKEQIRKTRLYRAKPQGFDKAMQRVTAEMILASFQKKPITSLVSLENLKKSKNQVKVEVLIEYIKSNQDYMKLYIEKGVKVNFVIVTWRERAARLKCYRYDDQQKNIVNAFQPIQRYQNHEFIEFNAFDLLLQFTEGGFTKFTQQNYRKDGFQLQCQSNLERGLYIFQGQSKNEMTSQFSGIRQNQRDKYLLISMNVSDSGKNEAEDQQDAQELLMIIDFDQSIKRSSTIDKFKERLNEIQRTGEYKKKLKLTSLSVNNQSFNSFSDHMNWIKMIKILNLSDNDITDISKPLELCPSLQKLNVSNNNIKQLSFKSLLPNLTDLDASQNNIKLLRNLVNIKRIESLNLKSNQLSHLTKKDHTQFLKSIFSRPESTSSSGFFGFFNSQSQKKNSVVKEKTQSSTADGFTYLRYLNIAHNGFENIDEFSSGLFPNITYLNVDDNLIVQVPSLEMEKLTELHLDNNCIENVSKFGATEHFELTNLYLRNNQISQMPKFNLPNLMTADISNNKMENIDQFISGEYFQRLTNLYLGKVHVSNIPELGRQIREFGFQSSEVSDQILADFISKIKLPKLKILYLTRNKITKLPNISSLVYLKSLFLDENPINDISQLFAQGVANQEQGNGKDIKSKLKWKKGEDNQNKQEQQLNRRKDKEPNEYKKLERFWVSLLLPSDKEFIEQKAKIENHMKDTGTICMKYDSVYGAKVQRSRRKFFLPFLKRHQYKQLVPKRLYLSNFFKDQRQANTMFNLIPQSGWYSLQQQWRNIDINEFIKYDWNQIESLDLRGTSFNDIKWRMLVQNAELFPNLKRIHLYENKIQTILKGDLQSFKALKQIDFYQKGMSNPLTKESKQYLIQFKKNNLGIKVDFQR